MKVPVYYNGSMIPVSIGDGRVAGIAGPNPVEAMDEDEVLSRALANPLRSAPFDDFAADGRNILFIVNDADRNTPTAKVLDLLPGVPSGRTRFLVASGTHPAPDGRQLEGLFGTRFRAVRDSIFIHDARDESALVRYGSTKRGTEIRLNRLFQEADRVIVIGSVEPHYFAGWTGGRKALLPGIAAFNSVEQNHRLAMENGAEVLALSGNPVHEDMNEVLELTGSDQIFSIQLVLDAKEKICFASAGDIRGTFDAAVEFAHRVYCAPVEEKAGIVVAAAAPPLDATLYQAHKGMENVRTVLKKDGILILAAGCSKGTGNDAFIKVLKAAGSPGKVPSFLEGSYRLGDHQAAKLAEMMERADIWCVSGLEPDLLRSIFIKPFQSLQEAVDAALLKKPESKVLFVNSATTVVPILKSGTCRDKGKKSKIKY